MSQREPEDGLDREQDPEETSTSLPDDQATDGPAADDPGIPSSSVSDGGEDFASSISPAGAGTALGGGFFRRRRFLLISTGILVALVAIAVAAALLVVLPALGQPGEATAKFLPAKTQAYITINFRPGGNQIMKARAFHSIFKDSLDFEDRRLELLDDLWDETGIDVMADVLPWIGRDITFALLDVADPKPEWIILLQIKDRDASEAFLDDLVRYLEDEEHLEFRDRRYRGGIVISEADDEVSFGVTDQYVLLGGGKDVVQDTIRDLASPPLRPLSEDKAFLRVREQLPSERFMLVFVRSKELYRDAVRTFDPYNEPVRALERSIPKVIGLSGTFIDLGIRFDSYSDTPRGAVIPEGVNHLNTAQALPDDTLFMISAIEVNEFWEQFRDDLEDIDRDTAEGFDFVLNGLKAATGIDLERHVIAELTGEVTVALLPSQLRFDGSEIGTIEALLLAEVVDPSRLERVLEDLTDFLEDYADLQVRFEKAGAYDMVTLDLSDQNRDVRNYSPGYLATENLMVLGSTVDTLFEVADTLEGRESSLQSAPEFSRLAELAPEGLSSFAFADIAGIIDMVVHALAEDDRRSYDKDWRPFLEPLDTFFTASVVSKESTVSTMVLTVRE